MNGEERALATGFLKNGAEDLFDIVYCVFRSRGSSGSTVSDYGLDDRGLIPGRGKGFFF
jgi:hypothetical protein